MLNNSVKIQIQLFLTHRNESASVDTEDKSNSKGQRGLEPDCRRTRLCAKADRRCQQPRKQGFLITFQRSDQSIPVPCFDHAVIGISISNHCCGVPYGDPSWPMAHSEQDADDHHRRGRRCNANCPPNPACRRHQP